MPRSSALAFWALIPGLVLSGCGTDTFMPPPNPELTAPVSEAPVRIVELVLPADTTPDQNALAQYLRLIASREKMSFRSSTLEPTDPPRSQADAIRKAAERGASVLIVQPAQDPDVTKALGEVRGQGVSSVLLASPLASGEDQAKPFPIVEAAPFADAAGKLVEAAVEAAKTAKVPAEATAVILTAAKSDADRKSCGEALTAALEKAHVGTSAPLTYDGSLEGAKATLDTQLVKDPKLAIVIVDDQVGLASVVDVRNKLKDKRPLVVVGYLPNDPSANETLFSQTAAVAIRNISQLARETFKVARQLAEGEEVPDRTAVPDEVRRYTSLYIEIPPEPMEGPPKTE